MAEAAQAIEAGDVAADMKHTGHTNIISLKPSWVCVYKHVGTPPRLSV